MVAPGRTDKWSKTMEMGMRTTRRYRLPEYPEHIDDYAAIQKWIRRMDSHFMSKGMMKTVLTGKTSSYPPSANTAVVYKDDGAVDKSATLALSLIHI